MYQTKNENNNNKNNDEWVLLINDDSSQIDEFSASTDTSTSTSKTSVESFNSDDALALKILDDTYDYEAQRPFVQAYPQEDNDCCYKSSTIKQLSNCNFQRKIIACVFLLGICTSIGLIIYFATQIEN